MVKKKKSQSKAQEIHADFYELCFNQKYTLANNKAENYGPQY